MKNVFTLLALALALSFGACTVRERAAPQDPQQPAPAAEVPARKPRKALETVSAEQLAAAESAGEAAGYTIYLRDGAGNFLTELPYDDQPKRGDVIAARAGEAGHVLGQYDTQLDQWGTLSPLAQGQLCFNNYRSLAFIDTATWEDSGFTLDFQTPSETNCRISSLAQDPDSGDLALIYQISSYERSSDGQVRPWLAYDNCDAGASDARMEIQRFDKEGRFLHHIVTELEPLNRNDVVDCLPNRYRDGQLTFLQKSYLGRLVNIDMDSGALSVLDCDNAILTDEVELLYRLEWREKQPALFHYSWYERGTLVGELSFEEEEDGLTLAYGAGEAPLLQASIDPAQRRAELSYKGRIFHQLDFQEKSAKVLYDYSGVELGEPLLHSPDGRYSIYRLMETSGGEAYFEELLAQHNETGAFTRLGVLNNAGPMAVTNDQLVVCYFDRLAACSLADGVWAQPVEQYGAVESVEQLLRKPLDLAYDAENRLILVLTSAYFDPFREDFSEEQIGTMALEVYGEDWSLLRSIDTGVAPPYELKAYGPYSPGLRLEAPGRLLLGKGERIVGYLG